MKIDQLIIDGLIEIADLGFVRFPRRDLKDSS